MNDCDHCGGFTGPNATMNVNKDVFCQTDCAVKYHKDQIELVSYE